MTQPTVKEWPKSDIETLDREIGARLQRLSAGRATAQDVSDAGRISAPAPAAKREKGKLRPT